MLSRVERSFLVQRPVPLGGVDEDPASHGKRLGETRTSGEASMRLDVMESMATDDAQLIARTRRHVPPVTTTTASTAEKMRAAVMDAFECAWRATDELFAMISSRALYTRGDRLRHVLLFYLGHTAVFSVNKLRYAGVLLAEDGGPKAEEKDGAFEALFAIGVDEMSWDDLLTEEFDWPPLEDVLAYRQRARAVIAEVIGTLPLNDDMLPVTPSSPWWAVLMGIEHDCIHLETTSVLVRQLPVEELTPSPVWATCPVKDSEPPVNELLPVLHEPATVRLGLNADDARFYWWDLEVGKRVETVQPFAASKYLVSNAEFFEFVQAGGYEQREYWTDEGWAYASFLAEKGSKHPRFWVPVDSTQTTFRLRNMLDECDMPWSWPVEVSQLEAKAFCNWKAAETRRKLRLPTEAEAVLMRCQEVPVDYPDWDRAPCNMNREYYCSPTPVDAFPASPSGLHDVIGNVWRHTETPLEVFSGYAVHPLYSDYSAPCVDGKHNVITGGCWISTGNAALPSARNFFRRHFMQHAGFRYVESDHDAPAWQGDASVLEAAVGMAALTDEHYAPERKCFAHAMAELASASCDSNGKRALDVGCGPGRASFELARSFDSVTGVDFTAAAIAKALELQASGTLKLSHGTVSAAELDLAPDTMARCSFTQGDACNLDPQLGMFDLVLAADVVDELYCAKVFFASVHKRVNPGGVLVLSTKPGDWSNEELQSALGSRWTCRREERDVQGRVVSVWCMT